jgi:uncharacterized protein YaaR (DUF327 family)
VSADKTRFVPRNRQKSPKQQQKATKQRANSFFSLLTKTEGENRTDRVKIYTQKAPEVLQWQSNIEAAI